MWAPTVVVPYTLAESDPHALYPHPQERSRIPRWASEGERLVSCSRTGLGARAKVREAVRCPSLRHRMAGGDGGVPACTRSTRMEVNVFEGMWGAVQQPALNRTSVTRQPSCFNLKNKSVHHLDPSPIPQHSITKDRGKFWHDTCRRHGRSDLCDPRGGRRMHPEPVPVVYETHR